MMSKGQAYEEQMRQIRTALANHCLLGSLEHMNALATTLTYPDLINELEDIRRSYEGILRYLHESSSNVDDNMHRIQERLLRRAFTAWGALVRIMHVRDEGSLFARTILTRVRHADWNETWNDTAEGDERFELQDELFEFLWTDNIWDSQDTAYWYEFIERQNVLVQQHLIGAITLSLWMFWDAERLTLLTLLAQSEHEEVRMQALGGYIVAAHLYADIIPFFPQTKLKESDTEIRSAMQDLQCEFSRTIESEIVEERETNEMDSLNKLHGEDRHLMELIALQRKYTRIRAEHQLDMSFGKRAVLQMCPFLKSLSHWWAPFDEARREVHRAAYNKEGKRRETFQLVIEASHECDLQLYLNCHMISGNNVRVEVKGEMPEDLLEHVDRTPLAIHKRVVYNLYRINRYCPVHQLLPDVFDSVLFAANPVLAPFFSAEDSIEHAHYLAHIGSKEEVLPTLLSIQQADGITSHLAHIIGQIYLKKEDYAQALTYFRQADMMDESSTDMLKEMALCCTRLGKRQEELGYLLRLYEKEPESIACMAGLAQIYYQQGDYEEANKYLYKLCFEHPDLTMAHVQLFLSEYRLGRTKQAEHQLQSLEETSPHAPLTHMVLGGYAMKNGQWGKALAHFRQMPIEEFVANQNILNEFSITHQDISLVIDALSQ